MPRLVFNLHFKIFKIIFYKFTWINRNTAMHVAFATSYDNNIDVNINNI